MLKRFYLTAFFFIAASAAFAQTGAIKGKVLDKTTNEPLPFASVVAELNGSQVGAAQTDFDGNFTIKPLNPGKYDLKSTFVGYTTAAVQGVIVSIDKTTFQDVKLAKGAVDIKQVDVTAYKVPLIDRGNPATQTTITQEDIRALPTRDVKSVAATAAGVVQKDEGDDLNVRGARSGNTYYYIDGVKVRGSQQLPKSGVEQVTVIQGGIPASYGDATGGIISITTRGPSKEFAGGINIESSQLFDDYNHLLGGFSVSGPIWSKKETDGTKKPVIGFFLSGEVQTDDDNDPSAIGVYRIKDDSYNKLKTNPLLPPVTASASKLQKAADYLTAADFEKVNTKQNTDNLEYRLNASIDIQPVKNVTLKIGGSAEYSKTTNWNAGAGSWGYENSLLNFDNNPQTIKKDYRAYARFTQRFGSESGNKDKSSSIIKNAYYSVQFDYTKNLQTDQSPRHEDRIFDYGYIGQFNSIKTPNYVLTAAQINGPDTTWIWNQSGFSDVYVQYSPGDINPEAQAYTTQYLTIKEPGYFSGTHDYSAGNYENIFQMQSNGAWLNGDNSAGGSDKVTANALFRTPGYNAHNFYRNFDNDQFRVSVMGSADIKNHAVMIGFEYEQRINRTWLVSLPGGIWATMRGLGNQRLVRGTNTNDTLGVTYASNGDSVYYSFGNSYTGNVETKGFYENLRDKLGKSYTEYVDIDALDRSVLSLDLFTPDELYGNNGGPGVQYFGFDYKGNKYSGNASFDDFFNKKENGNFTREIPAAQPTYMAGYIQDRFDFNDLSFNVGVRVDRYDANQKVLKDKYLLYQARTVGEARGLGLINGAVPANIGNDFVVYGTDKTATGAITPLGYRSGDKWYDANGNYVSDPKIIAEQSTTGNIEPLLTQHGDEDIKSGSFQTDNSFTDYDPQINVMPRIAFQFPISDQALFYAHYDVLTQRPIERSTMNPISYLFLAENATLAFNPALKPEKTTEYEMGFRQTLSRSSALSISAFYRELRDMIQVVNVPYADPIAYTTYDNVDFGTVKGFTLAYDLRRTGNVRLTASYTLQFADGTGSSSTSTNEIVNGNTSSSAYFRSIVPLDYDIRHNFIFNVDYRYLSGKDYNGPMLFGKQILANTGLDILFKGTSGSPYTGQLAAARNGGIFIGTQTTQTNKVDGSINGSRLPWQFRVDLKVDKDFAIKLGKNREDKKNLSLNVYVQVQNLLDSRNIISVYRFTGNPDDDGFLQSSLGQDYLSSLNNTDAFVDMYRIKANNPNNYSLPRRILVGLELNF